jgi:hypothetical protein
MSQEREAAIHAIDALCKNAARCETEERAMTLLEAHRILRGAIFSIGAYEFTAMMDLIHERIIRVIYDLRGEGRIAVNGIYAILFVDGMVKIGKTRNFSQRLKMLSDQSTSGVSASKFFPCEHHSKAEAIAHAEFAYCRVKNEFFKADFNDVLSLLTELTEQQTTTTH